MYRARDLTVLSQNYAETFICVAWDWYPKAHSPVITRTSNNVGIPWGTV